MTRKAIYVSVFSVLFGLSSTLVASADTLSLNFAGFQPGWEGGTAPAVGSNTAGVVNAGNWNDISLVRQTDMALVTGSGATSALTLSTAATYAWSPTAYWPNGANFTLPGDTQMMNGCIYQDSLHGLTLDVMFNGTLPDVGTFDMYIYYNANGGPNTQTFSIRDSSGVIRPGIATQTGYEAGGPDTAYIRSTGSNDSNYVLFSGLTSADLGTDFIVRAKGSMYGAMNGLQIVGQVSPVPEPSTFVFLAMGASCLLCYAWRRQQK